MFTKKVTFNSNIFKPTKTEDNRPTILSVFRYIYFITQKWRDEYKEEINLLEWLKAKLAGKGLQSELVYHGDWCWTMKIMINCKEITISAGPDHSSSEAQLVILLYTVNYKPDIDMCISWPFFKRNKIDECRNEIERLSTKINAILNSETRIHNINWFGNREGTKIFDETNPPS